MRVAKSDNPVKLIRDLPSLVSLSTSDQNPRRMVVALRAKIHSETVDLLLRFYAKLHTPDDLVK